MQYIHLIGPNNKKLFEKYLGKSHKELIVSTLGHESENDMFESDKFFKSGVVELNKSGDENEHVEETKFYNQNRYLYFQ